MQKLSNIKRIVSSDSITASKDAVKRCSTEKLRITWKFAKRELKFARSVKFLSKLTKFQKMIHIAASKLWRNSWSKRLKLRTNLSSNMVSIMRWWTTHAMLGINSKFIMDIGGLTRMLCLSVTLVVRLIFICMNSFTTVGKMIASMTCAGYVLSPLASLQFWHLKSNAQYTGILWKRELLTITLDGTVMFQMQNEELVKIASQLFLAFTRPSTFKVITALKVVIMTFVSNVLWDTKSEIQTYFSDHKKQKNT